MGVWTSASEYIRGQFLGATWCPRITESVNRITGFTQIFFCLATYINLCRLSVRSELNTREKNKINID